MKAIAISRYGGPEVLEYLDFPDPEPASDEVLIRVKAASVNPVDWKIRMGKLKFITGKNFPLFLGAEVSGVIEKAGAGVKGLEPGRRVFGAMSYKGGGYAELAVTKAERVIAVPESISFEEGCTFAVAGITPLQALKDMAHVKPGDRVLINGASGGVGIYAVQIAVLLGAEVSAVCSSRNVDFVRSLGAARVIDYMKEDFLKEKIKYHCILDAANNCTLKSVRPVLEKKGYLIKLNNSIRTILLQLLTSLTPGKKIKLLFLKNRRENLEWIRDRVADGRLKVYIDRSFALSEVAEAHRYSETLRARGKIVLIP
ncbi:MAG: NAD(P)-dependent alcohol dehydrogenase [Bacteroidota bacterium]